MTNNYLNLIENNHDSMYEANGNNKPWVSYNKEDKNVYYNHSSEYIEIGGIKWATKCIGASSPYSYDAWLFQWGDVVGHAESSSAGTTSYNYSWANVPFNDGNLSYSKTAWSNYSGTVLDNSGNLKLQYDAAAQLLTKPPLNGYSWRMPTHEEAASLIDYQLSLTNTTVRGIDGIEITIGSDAGVGNVGNVIGCCFGKTTDSTDNVLFIPRRGIAANTTLSLINAGAYMWTSSIISSDPQCGWAPYCYNAMGVDDSARLYGRCILPILVKDK